MYHVNVQQERIHEEEAINMGIAALVTLCTCQIPNCESRRSIRIPGAEVEAT